MIFLFFGSPVALLEPDLDCFLDRPRIHRFVDLPRVGSRLMVTMMIFDKSSTILCREWRLKSSGPCGAHRLKIHIKCSEYGCGCTRREQFIITDTKMEEEKDGEILQAQIFNLFVVVDRKLTRLIEVLHRKLKKGKCSEFNSRDD